MTTCPKCRQPIRHGRFGVYFPPLKARILDEIAAAGNGISPQELARLCWTRERGKEVTISNVQSHISQINDALAGSGIRIQSHRGIYQIARKRAA